MRHKTNFLFLLAQRIQRDQSNHTEISFIDEDVDVGTNVTARVLLMDSDVRPVYAVLLNCTYSVICDNC